MVNQRFPLCRRRCRHPTASWSLIVSSHSVAVGSCRLQPALSPHFPPQRPAAATYDEGDYGDGGLRLGTRGNSKSLIHETETGLRGNVSFIVSFAPRLPPAEEHLDTVLAEEFQNNGRYPKHVPGYDLLFGY